ncbi:MAG: alkaline phosphatase family protein [Phycisphaerae bacterium]|nr:alkaline phosphatase family protein [Phycisphaerae bacterium]
MKGRRVGLASIRWLAPIVMLCAGCNGPLHLRLADHVARPNPRVVLIFVDGVDRTLFREMLAAGELPNIKRYIVDRGAEVENAVSCLPTITYANTTTFLTGRVPGHHGVIANKWFDRERMLYQDYGYSETYSRINYDHTGPTIYELLSDKYTVSIQSPLMRGATRSYDNLITGAVTWWLGLLDWTDRLPPLRYEEVATEVSADPEGKWPSFVHTYFPAVDEYGHRYGDRHWGYRYALRNVDQQIWRICDGLDRVGLLERTTLVLVSDHGMTPIARSQRLYVKKALAKQFRRKAPHTWPEFSTDYHDRKRYLDRYDTIVASGGGRKCAVYLRLDENWTRRPSNVEGATTYCVAEAADGGAAATVRSIVRWLAEQPAVLIAAVPVGPDEVALHGADGEGVVSRKGAGASATYRYAVRTGSDPLGYSTSGKSAALMDGGYHSADAWFAATVETDAPDIPGQICSMFDTVRAGEIMLFAARGWGFSRVENAGHGSITGGDMFVPMYFAGPDIAVGGKVDRARTCDIMPTILDVLGVSDRLKDHAPIDGVSLLPKLRKGQVAKGL